MRQFAAVWWNWESINGNQVKGKQMLDYPSSVDIEVKHGNRQYETVTTP